MKKIYYVIIGLALVCSYYLTDLYQKRQTIQHAITISELEDSSLKVLIASNFTKNSGGCVNSNTVFLEELNIPSKVSLKEIYFMIKHEQFYCKNRKQF